MMHDSEQAQGWKCIASSSELMSRTLAALHLAGARVSANGMTSHARNSFQTNTTLLTCDSMKSAHIMGGRIIYFHLKKVKLLRALAARPLLRMTQAVE